MCVYTHTPTHTYTYTYIYLSPWKPEQIQHCSITGKACLKCFHITGEGSLAEHVALDTLMAEARHYLICFFDGISNPEHLFIRAARAPMYWLYDMIDEFVSVWAFLLFFTQVFTPFPFWGQFLVSWRSRFKCWGSRSPHVWSVGPGEPSNLRHTCAGRSGRVMQSRWTVSLLATGHAPRPNNAKLTALQSCVQVCSAGMFSGPPLQGHWHTHSSNLYMTAYGKNIWDWYFSSFFSGFEKSFLCREVRCFNGFKHLPAVKCFEQSCSLNYLLLYLHSRGLKSHPSSVHTRCTCETDGMPSENTGSSLGSSILMARIQHSSPAAQVCLTFSGEMQEKTPGIGAVLMDRGINTGIVPDLPTPDLRKTNSPPMGPEQIKYTLPSSTPGVTVIRGGRSAGGTEKGR